MRTMLAVIIIAQFSLIAIKDDIFFVSLMLRKDLNFNYNVWMMRWDFIQSLCQSKIRWHQKWKERIIITVVFCDVEKLYFLWLHFDHLMSSFNIRLDYSIRNNLWSVFSLLFFLFYLFKVCNAKTIQDYAELIIIV